MNKSLTYFIFGLLILTIMPFSMMDAYATTEHIVNGGFETGDFTGWTKVNTGSGDFVINDGALDPDGPQTPTPPISGSFDAVSEQTGPGKHILSEVFTVPSGITSSTVSWKDRIFNYGSSFTDPTQEVRIEIRDSTGTTVLTTLFTTNPGDPLIQAGPNSRSFDITAFMQANAGVDIRFCVVEEDNQFFFNYFIDDISLTTETVVQVGGTDISINTSALLLAGVQSISMWMIPVLIAGIGIGVFVIKRRN